MLGASPLLDDSNDQAACGFLSLNGRVRDVCRSRDRAEDSGSCRCSGAALEASISLKRFPTVAIAHVKVHG